MAPQLVAFLGVFLTGVGRDLYGYNVTRRQWVNARDENRIDLPPKPTFDVPLFLSTCGYSAILGLSTALGVNATLPS